MYIHFQVGFSPNDTIYVHETFNFNLEAKFRDTEGSLLGLWWMRGVIQATLDTHTTRALYVDCFVCLAH